MPRGRPRGSGAGKIKGAMSAYACFVKTCREEHQKLHPEEDVKFGEFSAQCSQRWKTMTDKEKERFHEMALEDKERFEFQMRDFVPQMGMGGGRRRRRRQKREKDPNRPKRALSAFFYFAKVDRPGIRAVKPEWTVGETAKELGKRWSEMDEQAKMPFDKQSEEDKARYDRDMKLYRIGEYRPPQLNSNGHVMQAGPPAPAPVAEENNFMDDEEEFDDDNIGHHGPPPAHGHSLQHQLPPQQHQPHSMQIPQHHPGQLPGHPQMHMPQMHM